MGTDTVLDRLRAFVERIGGGPEKVPPLREEPGEGGGRPVRADGGGRPSRVLDAVRRFIFRISGSPEKGAESAEKGFKIRVFEALGAKVIDSEEKVLRFSNRRVVLLTAVTVVFMVVVLYTFTIWSVGYTSSERFCISCHEMMDSYTGWKASSHYDNPSGVVAGCADCHLPVDMLSKIRVKIVTGARDTFLHYFGDPEDLDPMRLAENARRRITDGSCLRCHRNPLPTGISKGGFIAHRALQGGVKRKCVDCHKRLVHRAS